MLSAAQRLDLKVAEQSGRRMKGCLYDAEVTVQGSSAGLWRGNPVEEVS